MKKLHFVIAFVTSFVAAPAFADGVRESIPAAPFLAGAYAFMWVAVLVYVALVARRLSRVQSDIDDLRRKLDRQ
jgi:uncharacterized membrane protein (DUF485 family)